MIAMKKLNVVRVVDTEEEAAKLETRGFKRTGDAKIAPGKEKPPGKKKPEAKDGEPDGAGADQ